MRKKSTAAFICVFCLLLLSSCLQPIEVIEVEGFSNVEVSMKGVKSEMVVHVYNPNHLDFKINSADILLRVGEIVVGDLILEENLILESRDTTEVTLNLVSRKGAIGKIIVENFTNALIGGEVMFKAEGEIVSSTLGLKKRLPIYHEEQIAL